MALYNSTSLDFFLFYPLLDYYLKYPLIRNTDIKYKKLNTTNP